jgi:hypothetical protein
MRGNEGSSIVSIYIGVILVLGMLSSVSPSTQFGGENEDKMEIENPVTLSDIITNVDKENVLSPNPEPNVDNFQFLGKLLALDGAEGDLFGEASIFGDTIVVGAKSDDVGANIAQGSAYVFERNNAGADNWGQVKKLTASDGASFDAFGQSISISGDTIIVGVGNDDVGANDYQGSAYIFERNHGGADIWGQVRKLTASDGMAYDRFGSSVSISGDTVVVGSDWDEVGANGEQGSAYIFARNQGGADNWGQVTKLTASDGAANDHFGHSVSISGDTVVACAVGDNSYQGSAYVFERNQGGGDTWGQVTKITATDGTAGGEFDTSVSISCDTIVIGAYCDVGANSNQGAAYIIERNQGGADNWGQVSKLIASDGAADDLFGRSVSISSGTIVVGSYSDDIGANLSQGSTYIFERNQGGADNWGLVVKLTASDGMEGDLFGVSASISGDTIIIGASLDDVNANLDQGSAYTFIRTNETWMEISHPISTDGTGNDQFGMSVSICNNLVVIGARNDEVGANIAQGSAYVFERNQGGSDDWDQVTKLTASDGASNDHFGRSVAIYGDTIVIGSLFDDVGAINDQGSAYVYGRNQGSADNWGQVTKLTATDGAIDDLFGMSVSIFCDTIVVGAVGDNVGANADQGSAYIFERNQGGADNWGQVTKLTAADGAVGDMFGRSVSISNDKVVVGAYSDNVGANDDQGSAYIFERNQGGADNWGQVTKLTASDGAIDDLFGFSVSISGDAVIIGAHQDDIGAGFRQGSGYIFERNHGGSDSWGLVTKLTAPDGSANDRFGISVALFSDTVIVGAYLDNVGGNTEQGSAYVFERNQGGADNWGQVSKLTATDGATEDQFGYHVSISYNKVIVGAYLDNVSANTYQGSAYIYKLTPEFVIPLNEGWNLISLPLIQANTSIDQVLSSINGKWDYIQAYNTTDPDHWKTNATFKPDLLNDLKKLNHKIGFWINVTESRVYLIVSGNVSNSTSIPLYAGWNLVGYPTVENEAVANALWGTGADAVKVCDTSEPYHIKEVGPTYLMKPGEGYWVHVPADTVWIVDW